MAYEELKKHGITSETPENLMLGAGIICKNLVFGYYLLSAQPSDWAENYTNYYTRTGTEGSYVYTHVTGATAPAWTANTYYRQGWGYDLLGATSGGNKLSIKPEITTVEVDGALVKIKGLDRKTGETASLETNIIEITPELIKKGVIGKDATSDVTGYNLITSKPDIEAGDYYENFGYVGKKTDGTPIIVIFDNALCTSGFESEGKNKEASVVKCTFECYQECDEDVNLEVLPYRIYYPTPSNAQG